MYFYSSTVLASAFTMKIGSLCVNSFENSDHERKREKEKERESEREKERESKVTDWNKKISESE